MKKFFNAVKSVCFAFRFFDQLILLTGISKSRLAPNLKTTSESAVFCKNPSENNHLTHLSSLRLAAVSATEGRDYEEVFSARQVNSLRYRFQSTTYSLTWIPPPRLSAKLRNRLGGRLA